MPKKEIDNSHLLLDDRQRSQRAAYYARLARNLSAHIEGKAVGSLASPEHSATVAAHKALCEAVVLLRAPHSPEGMQL